MSRNTKGFTLIELILVMALIGILSVIGIGAYTQATIKSKDTQRKNDLNQIVKALESFNNDVGRYPLSDEDGNLICYKTPGEAAMDCAGKIQASLRGTTVIYMSKTPSDIDTKRSYRYESDGSAFALFAALENLEDKDVVMVNKIPSDWGVSCGNVNCNYKITETGLIKTK